MTKLAASDTITKLVDGVLYAHGDPHGAADFVRNNFICGECGEKFVVVVMADGQSIHVNCPKCNPPKQTQ